MPADRYRPVTARRVALFPAIAIVSTKAMPTNKLRPQLLRCTLSGRGNAEQRVGSEYESDTELRVANSTHLE